MIEMLRTHERQKILLASHLQGIAMRFIPRLREDVIGEVVEQVQNEGYPGGYEPLYLEAMLSHLNRPQRVLADQQIEEALQIYNQKQLGGQNG